MHLPVRIPWIEIGIDYRLQKYGSFPGSMMLLMNFMTLQL